MMTTVSVSVILLVYARALGQEIVVAQESTPTSGWQSAASDLVTEKVRRGPSALIAVHALPEWIELVFSAPVEFRSASLQGSVRQSNRFYVDISPVSLGLQRGAVFNIDTGPVRRVRLSLFRTGTIRAVLDLREERHFQVTTLTDPYRLIITPKETNAVVRQPQPKALMIETTPASVVAIQQEQGKEESQASMLPHIAWQPMLQSWSLMAPSLKTSSEESFKVDDRFESAVLNSTLSDDLPRISPALITSIDSALSSAADVSTDWLWEVACGGKDCPHIVEESNEGKKTKRDQIQMTEAENFLVAASPKIEEASKQHAQEMFRIGGPMVDQVWLVAMTAGVFLSFLTGGGIVMLWNLRQRGASNEKSDGWEGRMAYLEEAVNRAGMLNNSFFHSLDVSQKRLESLLTQSDVAERNLRRLLHQSAFVGEHSSGRGVDSLTTASLLLAEGEDVQQVARTLKLPMAQVRLLQELHSYAQEEKPTDSLEKSVVGFQSRNTIAAPDNVTSHLTGAARNGMHLAHNEHQL